MMEAGSGGGKDQDFELNLASIIDCFTVLITYLLVSASFISLGMLDVTVVADTGSETTHPASVTLTVAINKNGAIHIKTEGQGKTNISVPPKQNTWDFEAMVTALREIHERYPSLEAGVVTADDAVTYHDVVKAIEKVKTVLPQVAISPEMIQT